MMAAPEDDGEVILLRCKSGGVYLVYWGEIDGQWGWCDHDGGFAIGPSELDECLGWLPAPAIENKLAKYALA